MSKTKIKVDRALEEVWEWKAKANEHYRSLGNLSSADFVRNVNERDDELCKEFGLDLRKLPVAQPSQLSG